MIISNKDRNRLLSLLERYGYEKVSKFNVLNESFKSNILAALEKINSKPHVGLSGAEGKREEAPLSPVGAAFMKAFPIPWHLITDEQIKIYYNGNLSKYFSTSDKLGDNKVNSSRNKKYAEQYKRVRTNAYVTSNLADEAYEFNRLRKEIDKDIIDITRENTSLINSIGNKDMLSNSDENVWVNATKKLSEIYHKNKDGRINDYIILTTLSKLLDNVANSSHEDKTKDADDMIEKVYKEYTDVSKLSNAYNRYKSKHTTDIINNAKRLYDKFADIEGDTVTRWGVTGAIRTMKTDIDNYDSLEDMAKANVYDILTPLVKEDKIKNADINEFLEGYYTGTYVVNNVRRFAQEFGDYYIGKYKEDYISDEEDITNKINPELAEKYRDIRRELIRVYNEITKQKRQENNDEYSILKNLYAVALKKGDNNAGKTSRLVDIVKQWYSGSNNMDDYCLAVLMDKNFGIRYVFSCILFDKESIGYGVNAKAIYGWKIGDTPQNIEQELDGLDSKESYLEGKTGDYYNNPHKIEIKKRSGKKTIYNYNFIDPEIINHDKNIEIGMLITPNKSIEYEAPTSVNDYNKTILNYLKDENITRSNTSISTTDKDITSGVYNAKRIGELIEDNGIACDVSVSKTGKTIFTFKNPINDAKKIEYITNLLNGEYENNSKLTDALKYMQNYYNKLMYFESEDIAPKTFGMFYDEVLNNKVDFEHYSEDEINPAHLKALNKALYGDNTKTPIEYGYNTQDILSENKKQSLYQRYIGNRTDSVEKRVKFDSYMANPHYPEIRRKYNDARKTLRDIMHAILPDVVFNFDIKNARGVIPMERLRRMNREGRVSPYATENDFSKITKYTKDINNKKVFKGGGNIFAKITSDFQEYPFRTRNGGADYDYLKKTVGNAIYTLNSKINSAVISNKEKEDLFNTATNIYNDYMNIMNEFDNSDIIKNGTIDDAAKYVSTTLTDFYNKYSDYFVK